MLERAAALSLLLLAGTAHAQFFLGSERMVCQPRFQAPSASAVFAAANGSQTLAVVQPAGVEGSIYLQRLGAAVEPLTAHGVPIARHVGALGGIASNHDGFVVAWITGREVWAIAIGANGEVSSAPRLVARSDNFVNRPHIASNGVDYLVAWTDATGSTEQGMALRLDRDGNAAGAPFALSERRNVAAVEALASDGRDYLAVVERFGDNIASTTLVPVGAAGTVGAPADLPMFVRELVYTKGGYVGLWDENGTKAMAIDANGHTGAAATIGAATFLSAASNGADVMSVGFTTYRPATATRIRRSGDAIETIEQDLLLTQSFSGVMTGATHSGVYFTVSLTTVGLAPVSAPAAAERPLFTFAAPQRAPALAADGDLHVVAWQEGSLLRAARLRGDTTLDPAGIDVVNFGPADGFQAATAAAHALAVNAGRTLIAWTEQGYNGGEAPILVPVRVVGRILGADGTLAPSFTIDSIAGHDSSLTLGGVVATSAGFAVLVGRGYSWRVVSVNAAGQLLGAKDLDLTAAINPALTRRADGFLLAYTEPPKDDLVAVPVHADGTSAGSPQIIGGTAERANFPGVAGDGNGHLLAVWSENDRLLARPLDESGVPAGPAHDLGVAGALARVTWNGSAFVIVSGADVVLTALDGGVRSRQVWNGSLTVFQPGVAGDTITALHSGIDAGVGDTAVLFVTRFSSVVRRHAARP